MISRKINADHLVGMGLGFLISCMVMSIISVIVRETNANFLFLFVVPCIVGFMTLWAVIYKMKPLMTKADSLYYSDAVLTASGRSDDSEWAETSVEGRT